MMAVSWGHLARAFLVVLMLTGGAAATFLTAPPVQAQAITIQQISISGNQRVERATILAYAEVAVGQTLSAGQVNAAGQRLRASGLFETVTVTPSGTTLVIRVVELPTINRIAVEGNQRLDDDTLLALVTSESRRVFSPATAEADAAAISAAYGAAGRIAATVEPRIIRRSDNRVDLVFEVTEGRVVEVERIAFVGNRAYSDRRLRRVLQTKQAGFLRTLFRNDTFLEDRVAFDRQLLTDFYHSRGYVDFEVLAVASQLTRRRDAFLITFNIREGQRFAFGDITVVSEVPEVDAAGFAREVRLRKGGIYSPVLVDGTIDRLERLATKQALTFVRVEPRVTRNNRERTLDIQFVLVRGPRVFVERIDIEGNTTTLDRVIRREFRVVEGDPFNPREISAAAERIRALGYFSQANVTPRQGTTQDRVIVDVDVDEQPTGTLSFGASYSPESGGGIAISFSESNFLGRGQTVRLSVTSTQDSQNFSGSFIEPYFLGRNVRYRASLNLGQSDDADNTFDTESFGFSTGIGFSVGDFSRLELNYSLTEDTVSGVNPLTSSAILQAEEGSLITSSVGYAYRFDTRNRGLDPSRGIMLRFGQEFAGLGGDNEYVKTTGALMGEMDILNEEVTLRATLEGGNVTMINGNSRVTDRFFASARYVRGFAQNGYGPRDLSVPAADALGGNNFVSLKLETEFPLGLPEELGISGGLFFDVGTVWGLDNVAGGLDGLTEVDDSMILRSAAGVSIFWRTPIGPLRFNFSEVVQSESYDIPQNFELTVSTQF